MSEEGRAVRSGIWPGSSVWNHRAIKHFSQPEPLLFVLGRFADILIRVPNLYIGAFGRMELTFYKIP